MFYFNLCLISIDTFSFVDQPNLVRHIRINMFQPVLWKEPIQNIISRKKLELLQFIKHLQEKNAMQKYDYIIYTKGFSTIIN